VALQLKRRGIRRVRPLEGGYTRWKQLNYPVVPWEDGTGASAAPVPIPA
jgi:rhodanese-related sulfurtransferase